MTRNDVATLLKSHRITLLKAGISVILLVILLSRLDPIDMWRVVRTTHLRYLLLATVFSPIIFLIKTLKWFILGRQVNSTISLRSATLSLLAGMGVGLVTPSRVGEVARVSYLPISNKSSLIGVVAIDRLFDLSAILLSGAIALGFALDLRLAIGVLIPVIGMLIILFIPDLPGKLVNQIAKVPFMPWENQFSKIAMGVSALKSHILFLTLSLALLTFALGTYQFYWLLRSFDKDSLLAAIVSFPILTIAGVLPVTIGGFGTREGASVIVLSLYHIPKAIAINATLLSFILNSLIPGIIGLVISPMITSTISNPFDHAPHTNPETQNDHPL